MRPKFVEEGGYEKHKIKFMQPNMRETLEGPADNLGGVKDG